MRQIVEDRQTEYREPTPLEVLPGGRDARAQKERQKRLAVRAKTDRKAAGKLLAEMLPRVRGEARRHLGQGVDFEDLVQEGLWGVMKAIQAYTPQRGASFATYAHWWAHGAMRRAVAWHQRTIRVPEKRGLIAGKERKARERVQHELGRTPTDHEVAQAMGVDVDEVWRIQVENAALESVEALMEGAEVDDEDTTGPRPSESRIFYLRSDGRDPTGVPERVAMRKVLPDEMRQALRKLRGRDRRVIRGRYWFKLPRRVIAERMGISVDAVRWSENRALETLQEDEKLWEYWKNWYPFWD
jgi:RNA polymerase sigma factor (sigma-70 family)